MKEIGKKIGREAGRIGKQGEELVKGARDGYKEGEQIEKEKQNQQAAAQQQQQVALQQAQASLEAQQAAAAQQAAQQAASNAAIVNTPGATSALPSGTQPPQDGKSLKM